METLETLCRSGVYRVTEFGMWPVSSYRLIHGTTLSTDSANRNLGHERMNVCRRKFYSFGDGPLQEVSKHKNRN